MRSLKQLPDSLLDQIYDAAGEEQLWPAVLTKIAELTGGQGAIMLGLNSSLADMSFEYNGGLDPLCARSHQKHHLKNPWSTFMIVQPVGRLVVSDEIIPVKELKRTAFYDDVLHPQRAAYNAMACIGRGSGFVAAFNIVRSARKGFFSTEEQALQRRVLPHVRRAVTLGMRIQEYGALQAGAYDALELMTHGVLLLDCKGRVLFANAPARRQQGRTVSFDARGIRAIDLESHSQLTQALKAVLNGAPSQVCRLRFPQGGSTVHVVLSSLRRRDLDRFTAVTKAQPAVMMFICDAHAELSVVKLRLATLYGLTDAEVNVALAVAKGGFSPRDAAAQLKLSVNTIKTHLRRTYAKMNVRGHAELALIVAELKSVR